MIKNCDECGETYDTAAYTNCPYCTPDPFLDFDGVCAAWIAENDCGQKAEIEAIANQGSTRLASYLTGVNKYRIAAQVMTRASEQ